MSKMWNIILMSENTNQDYSGAFLPTYQTLHIESGALSQNTLEAEHESFLKFFLNET